MFLFAARTFLSFRYFVAKKFWRCFHSQGNAMFSCKKNDFESFHISYSCRMKIHGKSTAATKLDFHSMGKDVEQPQD